MSVPVYIAYSKSDSEAHIVIGKNIQSLCDKKDIISAVYVPWNVSPIEFNRDSNKEICQTCVDRWEEVEYEITREQTIICDNCQEIVSGYTARTVEDKSANEVPICKTCYQRYNNESSNIDTAYVEAPPHFDKDGNRTYNYNKN